MKLPVICALLFLSAVVSGAPTTPAVVEASTALDVSEAPPAAVVSGIPTTTVVSGSSTTPVVSGIPTTPVASGSSTTPSTSTSSSEDDDEPLIIKDKFFIDDFVLYRSEHDIVSVVVPTNGLNFGNDDDAEDDTAVIFFVEADIKDGKKDYKGLYMHDRKTAKLILSNGRDASASIDDNDHNAYFAASDGIYFYDEKSKSAKKYGTFDKSSFAIAKPNGTDAIYVLTDEKNLYNITNEGKTAQKVDSLGKIESIVVDGKNNLYFLSADKVPKVYDGENIKSFTGLPTNPSYIALIRPTFLLSSDSIPAVIDGRSYLLYANGTSELTTIQLEVYPSAYGIEVGLVQYYGYEKKLYQYDFLALLFSDLADELKSYLDSKKNDIQSLASQSKSDLERQ